MNKKIIFISTAVILFILGGTFLTLKIYQAKKVEEIFNSIVKKYNLDKEFYIKVGDFDYNLFTKEAILEDVYLKPKENIPPNQQFTFYAKEIRIKYEVSDEKKGFLTDVKILKSKVKYPDEEFFYPESRLLFSYKNEKVRFYTFTNADKLLELETDLHLKNFDESIFNILRDLMISSSTVLKNNNYDIYLEKNRDKFIILLNKVLAIIPEKFKLRYKEKGFFKKALTDIAKEFGTTYEEVKYELLSSIDEMLANQKNPNIKTLLEALKYMIENNKGELKIEIKNKSNLSFQDLLTLWISYDDPDLFLEKLADKFDIKVEFRK